MDQFINDEAVPEVTLHGNPMRFWDDGFGPLWLYCNSLGPLGVVRATSFEDAWGACVDEILDGATQEDVEDALSCLPLEDAVRVSAAGDLPEGFGFRNSGEPSSDDPAVFGAIYQEDLNGSSLEVLTPVRAEELGIEVRGD
jgi:hypothetical protein